MVFSLMLPNQPTATCRPSARPSRVLVRTAAAFVEVTLGDDLNEERIRLRRADAGEFPDAVEVGILRLHPLGSDGDLELVRSRCPDLVEFADPGAVDVRSAGARRRRAGLLALLGRRKSAGSGANWATAGPTAIAAVVRKAAANKREDLIIVRSLDGWYADAMAFPVLFYPNAGNRNQDNGLVKAPECRGDAPECTAFA